jgi:hypothetical protein
MKRSGGVALAGAAAVLVIVGGGAGGGVGVSVASAAILLICGAVVRRRYRGAPGPGLRLGRRHARPDGFVIPSLESLTRRVGIGMTERRYFDRTVRPELWRIATSLAARNRGDVAALRPVLLDLLGAEGELLDPERPGWEDRVMAARARGPELAQLERLISRIEAL